jgi:DNA-binding protein H-NS
VKFNLESLTLPELKALNTRVDAAIITAREREKAELRQALKDMAAQRGLNVAEIFETMPAKPAKNPIPRWQDRKTGVQWVGRGRYPPGFDKSRASPLR